MCVGILPIAEAGLLRGQRVTSYAFSRGHDNLGRLRELGCCPTSWPIEVSKRIISCSGPAQSTEVAMLLLKSLVDADTAREVSILMAGSE
jgi:4-methyl-5(b-hydroxyethyl)-thiazole monophosphate biosynthesis